MSGLEDYTRVIDRIMKTWGTDEGQMLLNSLALTGCVTPEYGGLSRTAFLELLLLVILHSEVFQPARRFLISV